MADILGIGNALLDIFWFSDEDSALPLGLHPNRAAHVTPDRLDELTACIPSTIYSAGGSAANALKAARMLGSTCEIIGCAGTDSGEEDRWAALFREEMAREGIEARLAYRHLPTGRCLVIHMPGSMTSIACAPGAAPEIITEQITDEDVAACKAVFFDGQLLRNEEIILHTADLCARHGKILVLDMASIDVCRTTCALVEPIAGKTELCLFMNSDEAAVLALAMGLEPSNSAERLYRKLGGPHNSKLTLIEKRGADGAMLFGPDGIFSIPGVRTESVLDTTGCGDVFEGTWLHAVLSGLSSRDAAWFANRAAAAKTSWPGSLLDRSFMNALALEISAARGEQT